MKKSILTLAMAAICGSAMAQQLPNVGFENWKGKGKTGESYTTYGGGSFQRPGDEPQSWNGSNVTQVGTPFATMCEQNSMNNNKFVTLKNIYCGAFGKGSTAPGFISLGQPWIFAKVSLTEVDQKFIDLGDGGVSGGIEFTHRPDAIRLKYKKSAVNNETSHIIAYLWDGTFVSQIPTDAEKKKTGGSTIRPIYTYSISKYENRDDVDRAILGLEKEDKVVSKGSLIASVDKEITTNTTDWTETGEIPLNYTTLDKKPSKMNVIISSGNYWNRLKLQQNSQLDVDDVEFVYYKTLKSLKVNGTDITLKENTYEYEGVGSISNGCIEAEAKSPFANVAYTYNADNVIITVTADNGETQEYKVAFENAVTPPNASDIEGKYYNEIDVRLGDENGEATYSFNEVTISANTDNSVNFILKGFKFMGKEIGNVNVTNVPVSWSGENIALKCSKNIDIETTNPEAEELGLKNLPMVLAAEISTAKELTAKLQITWNGNPIFVDIVKQPFSYKAANGNITVSDGEIDDESIMKLYSFAVEDKATSIDMSNSKVTTTMLNDLTDAMPNTIFYVGNQNYTGNNIVKDGITSAMNLADKYVDPEAGTTTYPAFGIPTAFTAESVSFNREFQTGDYVSSFILPFGFDVPAGVTVAELSTVNGSSLVFKPVTKTVANKPYIVKTNDANFINSLTNVEVKPTIGESLTTTVDGVNHVGSYTSQEVSNVYGYANGKFVKVNSGTVNPFRTYITYKGTAAAPMAFNVEFAGEVTGINNAEVITNNNNKVYNLQGIHMNNNLNTLPKGVYVVGGKKIIK